MHPRGVTVVDDIPVTYSNRANGCYVSLRGEGLGEQAFSFEVKFGCVSSWKNPLVEKSNFTYTPEN